MGEVGSVQLWIFVRQSSGSLGQFLDTDVSDICMGQTYDDLYFDLLYDNNDCSTIMKKS